MYEHCKRFILVILPALARCPSDIPYIDVFTNYFLSVSKIWTGGGLADIIKIVIHFLMECRMSGVHRANAGNAAKINRLRCSYIENSYCKKTNRVCHCCKTMFVLARQRSRICLMNKHISFIVKIKTPVHVYIWYNM